MWARPRSFAWLGLAGLGLACLAMTTVRIADVYLGLSAQALWFLCCPGAERLSIWPGVNWLQGGLLAAGVGLSAFGAANLAARLARTHRFVVRALAGEAVDTSQIGPALLELGLEGLVRLVVRPEPIVFCYGFLRPRICVSTGLVQALSPPELRAVLLHERHHLERWHPLRTLILQSVAAMFSFLPGATQLCEIELARMELEADQAAIRGAGRERLASALYRLLSLSAPPGRHPRLALNLLNVTQARIDHLLDGSPLPRWRPELRGIARIPALVALTCLLVMSLVG